MSTPYVVTVQPGQGDIVYRIASRVPLAPYVNYHLCFDGKSLCQQTRR